MVGDDMETETLARLYLEQGHPEWAARIFERLLARDPAGSSAAEGLARCRALLRAGRTEEHMNASKRLRILQGMLARLRGEAPPEAILPVAPLAVPAQVDAPADPRRRRLQVLRSMLEKLQFGRATH